MTDDAYDFETGEDQGEGSPESTSDILEESGNDQDEAILESIGDIDNGVGDTLDIDLVESISQIDDEQFRPFLTTEFSDYSVTEGLLLALLLFTFLSVCVRVLKEGFFWL